MKLRLTRPRRRGGFTFIELMVVVVIIAVLIGLLTSAVVTALNKMDDTAVRNDISGLSNGVTQFQSDYNLQNAPPPSRLWLDDSGQYTTNPTSTDALTPAQLALIAADSKAYLGRVWPQLRTATVNASGQNVPTLRPTTWNPNSPGGKTNTVLEGQQCLIFFLGGAFSVDPVTKTIGTVGFSTDTTNPMGYNPNNGQPLQVKRKGPYYQFNASRLRVATNGFLQYLDAYGTSQPYAYFSSGNKPNGYNAYGAASPDCPSLLAWGAGDTTQPLHRLQPYFQSTTGSSTQFYKPDTFQIISAGKDGLWGIGGAWNPSLGATAMKAANAGAPGNHPGDGIDDLSNFYDAKLGTKQ